MTYYLGLDLGTGSLKTVLFDVNGLEIAASAVEYPLYQPHNGWSGRLVSGSIKDS